MMAYIFYSDANKNMVQLGALAPAGEVASTWVNSKIEAAETELNGRISSKYITPIVPTPDILKTISLKLTTYEILRQNYTQEIGNESDWVMGYKREADALIKDINDGTITLDAPVAEISNAQDAVQSSTMGIARKFTDSQYTTDGDLIVYGTLDGF